MSKEIKLTQGKFAIVDDAYYESLNKFKWYASNRKGRWAACRADNINNDKKRPIYMHRVIINAPKGICVDHKDRNGLNNQRDNLRLCTKSQNAMNINKQKNTSSSYLGVIPEGNKFRARISCNRVSYNLGLFTTEKDAALARDKKAIELHKEFASLNFDNKELLK